MTSRASSWIDDIFNERYFQVEYMQQITDTVWRRAVAEYFVGTMPNYVSRVVMFAIHESKGPCRILRMRCIFASLVAEVPALREIILQQMLRSRDMEALRYFENEQVHFIQLCFSVVSRTSFYVHNVNGYLRNYMVQIQMAWNTRDPNIRRILVADEERLIKEQDSEIFKTPGRQQNRRKRANLYAQPKGRWEVRPAQ